LAKKGFFGFAKG